MLRKLTIERIAALLTAVLLLSAAVSCVENVPYDSRVSFSDGKWCVDEVLGFRIDSLDASETEGCRMLLTARCRDSFRYDTLWVVVSGASLDRELPRDTVALVFPHAESRRRGLMGSEALLPYNVTGDGVWEIEVAHCMLPDTLEGVINIGIRLEKNVSR